MRDYFCSDLKRIMKRVPRIVTVLIGMAFIVFYFFVITKLSPVWNRVEFIANYQNLGGFIVMALGLVELISVFSDDFKAKTMQIGIGIGIPRPMIVLCKLLEVAVLTAVDLFLLSVCSVVFACLTGAAPVAAQISDLFAINLCSWLNIVAIVCLTMILIFFMQSTGVATILYLFLSAKVTSTIGEALLSLGVLEPLRLSNFLLSRQVSVLQAQLLTGNFNIAAFITVIIYIVLGYFVTVMLFRNRELEF